MEREIKFRTMGRDGKWKHCIMDNSAGQIYIFTGLKDKHKEDIYSGDIVKTKYGRVCLVVWKSSPSHVGFDLKPIETEHPCPSGYDLYKSDNLEVIGNIYDNPEQFK